MFYNNNSKFKIGKYNMEMHSFRASTMWENQPTTFHYESSKIK